MKILSHNTSGDASKNSTNSTRHPWICNQILRSIIWIFPCLNTHYCIRYDIHKSFG
jgi:hypothetical protein